MLQVAAKGTEKDRRMLSQISLDNETRYDIRKQEKLDPATSRSTSMQRTIQNSYHVYKIG
jgi:hypothetical protein